jgi:hypothetical protein
MLKTKFAAFILTLTVFGQIFLITSCSQKDNYRNDISCYELTDDFINSQSNSHDYSYYSGDEISFFIKIPDYVTDVSVIYSTDVNDINEIGVFRCADEKGAEAFLAEVSSYLQEQQKGQKAFISSYAPREVPKLEGAEARRYGSYVIYTVLSSDDKKTLWETAEKKLRG